MAEIIQLRKPKHLDVEQMLFDDFAAKRAINEAMREDAELVIPFDSLSPFSQKSRASAPPQARAGAGASPPSSAPAPTFINATQTFEDVLGIVCIIVVILITLALAAHV